MKIKNEWKQIVNHAEWVNKKNDSKKEQLEAQEREREKKAFLKLTDFFYIGGDSFWEIAKSTIHWLCLHPNSINSMWL